MDLLTFKTTLKTLGNIPSLEISHIELVAEGLSDPERDRFMTELKVTDRQLQGLADAERKQAKDMQAVVDEFDVSLAKIQREASENTQQENDTSAILQQINSQA